MNIIDRIKAGCRNNVVVRWPGTDSEITLRVLSKAELHEATFAAHHRFVYSKVSVEAHTIETFKDEETVQILYRALSGVGDETGKPLAASVDKFRANVSSEEISELAQRYEQLQDECSPSMEAMSDEQFDAFLNDLKKKPEPIISSVSSIDFARRLLRSLVAPPES